MVAGLLNIRAERTFEWPQQQDIGALRLNFIRIQPKAQTFAVAIINTVPVIVGLLLVSWIANSNLALPAFLATLGTGVLADIGPAFIRLTTAADFWLWFYLAFTISNTMLPDVERLRGWRIVLPIAGVVALILVIAGAGNEFITNVMNGPVANSLNALSGVLGAIIVLNVMGVAILGTIEALVERVTGNSATFKDNKMIVMTRAELLQQREEAFQSERKRLTASTSRKPALPAPTNQTIYSFPLPIPGTPGKEPVRQEGSVILPGSTSAPAQAALPVRDEPKVIPGTTVESPAATSSSQGASPPPFGSPAPRPPAPGAAPSTTAGGVSPPRPTTPQLPGSAQPARPAAPTAAPQTPGGMLPQSPAASSSAGTGPARPAQPSVAPGRPSLAPARPIGTTAPAGSPATPASNSPARPSFPALPTGTNRPGADPASTSKPAFGNKPDDQEDDEDEVRYVDLEDSP